MNQAPTPPGAWPGDPLSAFRRERLNFFPTRQREHGEGVHLRLGPLITLRSRRGLSRHPSRGAVVPLPA